MTSIIRILCGVDADDSAIYGSWCFDKQRKSDGSHIPASSARNDEVECPVLLGCKPVMKAGLGRP